MYWDGMGGLVRQWYMNNTFLCIYTASKRDLNIIQVQIASKYIAICTMTFDCAMISWFTVILPCSLIKLNIQNKLSSVAQKKLLVPQNNWKWKC